MADYTFPTLSKPHKVKKNQVLLVASGDLRLSANQVCWPAQQEMEQALSRAVADAGYELVRAHPFKAGEKHGFIGSQKEGMEVFREIDPAARLIVAEAVWQYSHHVLVGPGLARRPDADRGQLVGHVAGAGRHAQPQRLADQGRPQVFDFVERGLHRQVLRPPPQALARQRFDAPPHGPRHAIHRRAYRRARNAGWGRRWPRSCCREKAILGVFDEGCMGMFNAIIPDDLLHAIGVYQRAAQPIGAVLRNDASPATTRPRPCAAGWNRAV